MKQTGRGSPDDLLTVRQAAIIKGCHRGTLYKALREGRLMAFRPEKPYLIRRRDLDIWAVEPRRLRFPQTP